MILALELTAAFVGGVLAAFVAAVKLGPWFLRRKMNQAIIKLAAGSVAEHFSASQPSPQTVESVGKLKP